MGSSSAQSRRIQRREPVCVHGVDVGAVCDERPTDVESTRHADAEVQRRPPGVIGTIDVGAKREQHAGGRRIAMHGGHMQRRVPRQVERVDRRAVFA